VVVVERESVNGKRERERARERTKRQTPIDREALLCLVDDEQPLAAARLVRLFPLSLAFAS
jgi:hypothetical protein